MTIKNHQPTIFSFVFIELCIFASQVFVFFLVAVFTSDFLRSEQRLTEFSESKVNSNTMSELGITLLAITVALGVLSILSTLAPSKFVERLSREILQELPRTIYFFGSSITAITMAVAVYISNHPTTSTRPASGFAAMAAFLAISFFIYGCGLKALLLVKEKRLATAAKQNPAVPDAD